MHQEGLVKIILYLKEHNLTEKFSETAKLLSILITITMRSTEAERTF